ncbi:sugar transferase [Patescibacteria group bacterium]|nr:sugar transferase [Patescibacteria group bacterium]
MLDIIGCLICIVIFFPVMVVVSIWIKIVSSEGPILADIPDRVGKDRKPFRFFKFRSMYPNAHNLLKEDKELYAKYIKNNYKLNAEDDPRIIKGGKFLRKSSIDEFPQFFNVLKGEMSLVGPRAYYYDEIKDQVKRFPEAGKYLDKVMEVKPGITGLWQVSGRSDIGFVDRVKLDSKYAENVSLLYDIRIVLKTPYVVLMGKGSI